MKIRIFLHKNELSTTFGFRVIVESNPDRLHTDKQKKKIENDFSQRFRHF